MDQAGRLNETIPSQARSGAGNDWQIYRDQIQALSGLEYNYDEKLYHDSQDKKGWFLDRYSAKIGVEEPGEPLADGPFQSVKEAIRLYQFPEPHLISAVFNPEAELKGRDMLMFARFAGFTFNFGVRVTGVVDELRTLDNGEVMKVWGYSYRTLKGHFEVGEIQFEVSKNLNNGEIFFEIDSYSKPEKIPNLFYRMGFRVFGRPLQRYFAYSSMKRLRKIANSQ